MNMTLKDLITYISPEAYAELQRSLLSSFGQDMLTLENGELKDGHFRLRANNSSAFQLGVRLNAAHVKQFNIGLYGAYQQYSTTLSKTLPQGAEALGDTGNIQDVGHQIITGAYVVYKPSPFFSFLVRGGAVVAETMSPVQSHFASDYTQTGDQKPEFYPELPRTLAVADLTARGHLRLWRELALTPSVGVGTNVLQFQSQNLQFASPLKIGPLALDPHVLAELGIQWREVQNAEEAAPGAGIIELLLSIANSLREQIKIEADISDKDMPEYLKWFADSPDEQSVATNSAGTFTTAQYHNDADNIATLRNTVIPFLNRVFTEIHAANVRNKALDGEIRRAVQDKILPALTQVRQDSPDKVPVIFDGMGEETLFDHYKNQQGWAAKLAEDYNTLNLVLADNALEVAIRDNIIPALNTARNTSPDTVPTGLKDKNADMASLKSYYKGLGNNWGAQLAKDYEAMKQVNDWNTRIVPLITDIQQNAPSTYDSLAYKTKDSYIAASQADRDSFYQTLVGYAQQLSIYKGKVEAWNREIATLRTMLPAPSNEATAQARAALWEVVDKFTSGGTIDIKTITTDLNTASDKAAEIAAAIADLHKPTPPAPKVSFVPTDDGGLQCKLHIPFATGKSDLPPSGKKQADDIKEWLWNHPEATHIELQGHTDDIGKGPSNLTLSKKRAKTATEYLKQQGVPDIRMSSTGYGSNHPEQVIDQSWIGKTRKRNTRTPSDIETSRSINRRTVGNIPARAINPRLALSTGTALAIDTSTLSPAESKVATAVHAIINEKDMADIIAKAKGERASDVLKTLQDKALQGLTQYDFTGQETRLRAADKAMRVWVAQNTYPVPVKLDWDIQAGDIAPTGTTIPTEKLTYIANQLVYAIWQMDHLPSEPEIASLIDGILEDHKAVESLKSDTALRDKIEKALKALNPPSSAP